MEKTNKKEQKKNKAPTAKKRQDSVDTNRQMKTEKEKAAEKEALNRQAQKLGFVDYNQRMRYYRWCKENGFPRFVNDQECVNNIREWQETVDKFHHSVKRPHHKKDTAKRKVVFWTAVVKIKKGNETIEEKTYAKGVSWQDALKVIEKETRHIPNRTVERVKYGVSDLRRITGLNQQDFCELYHIPVRTAQNWELGLRKILDFVLFLLEQSVLQDMDNNLFNDIYAHPLEKPSALAKKYGKE